MRAAEISWMTPAPLMAALVAGMQTGTAWLAAFHPANALVMLIVALDVLRRARAGQPA